MKDEELRELAKRELVKRLHRKRREEELERQKELREYIGGPPHIEPLFKFPKWDAQTIFIGVVVNGLILGLFIGFNVLINVVTKGWWLLFLGNTLLAVVWSIPCACVPTLIVWAFLHCCSTGYGISYSQDGKTWTLPEHASSPSVIMTVKWGFHPLRFYGVSILGVCVINLLCVHIVSFRDSTFITTALKGHWLFLLGNTGLVVLWSAACAIVLAFVGMLSLDAAKLASILLYVLVLVNFAAAYIFSYGAWYNPLRMLFGE